MGRIGCWHELAHQELTRTAAIKGITIHSISTHLPSADEDADFTDAQLSAFWKSTADFRKTAPAAKFHVLNSAGVLTRPESAGDVVRLGLALYGASPLPALQKSLRPVLTWKSRVVLVRDLPAGTGVSYGRTFITTRPMRTAVIAVGYADGFPRHASGQGAEVLIHGIRCPIIGRVTMDQIVVDATSLPSLSSGDVATLIGADGDGEIPVSELAECSGTIAWDIFTGIGKRVARFYKDSQPI
jgi:alanine racemase